MWDESFWTSQMLFSRLRFEFNLPPNYNDMYNSAVSYMYLMYLKNETILKANPPQRFSRQPITSRNGHRGAGNGPPVKRNASKGIRGRREENRASCGLLGAFYNKSMTYTKTQRLTDFLLKNYRKLRRGWRANRISRHPSNRPPEIHQLDYFPTISSSSA